MAPQLPLPAEGTKESVLMGEAPRPEGPLMPQGTLCCLAV